MYYKGDKLFWYLRFDFSGRRLLKVRQTKLRQALTSKYLNHLLYKYRILQVIFRNKPVTYSVKQLWRLRSFMNFWSFGKVFYANSTSIFLAKYSGIVLYHKLRHILTLVGRVARRYFLKSNSFFLPNLSSVSAIVVFDNSLKVENQVPNRKRFSVLKVTHFYLKECFFLERLRSRIFRIRKAHYLNTAATYRPKKFYLFLGEKKRLNYRKLLVRPKAAQNQARLKAQVQSQLYRQFNLITSSENLVAQLMLSTLSSSLCFLPSQKYEFFRKFFIVNNVLQNTNWLLSPGDCFHVAFAFWSVVRFFLHKRLTYLRWSLLYRNLYLYKARQYRARQAARWSRILWFFRQNSLSWNPVLQPLPRFVEFSYLILSGIILTVPATLVQRYKWLP